MSNVGELDRGRRFLRDNPDLHAQRKWVCGTTACVAGWAVALHRGIQTGEALYDADDLQFCSGRDIADRAMELLGLTLVERVALFQSTARGDDSEVEALLLIDALIARDKGELCNADRVVLRRYGLPEEPAGDAA